MRCQLLVCDAAAFVRAVVTNQIARFMPRAYVRMTRQTGRGDALESTEEVAEYFNRCFDDYLERLHVPKSHVAQYLRGKAVLEYGPGSVLGVALLFYAYGAAHVCCVDRFPLQRMSEENKAVLKILMTSLQGNARARAETAFSIRGDVSSGFDSSKISYRLRPSGLSGEASAYDLILSRAVLEHVDDLDATFSDIAKALRSGGVSVHLVDLKSHGLDRRSALDFLTWPEWAYRWMYSNKGYPNRWRIDRYRALIAKYELQCRSFEPTEKLERSALDAIRERLAPAFKRVPTDDLCWLGFWMILQSPDGDSGIGRDDRVTNASSINVVRSVSS